MDAFTQNFKSMEYLTDFEIEMNKNKLTKIPSINQEDNNNKINMVANMKLSIEENEIDNFEDFANSIQNFQEL